MPAAPALRLIGVGSEGAGDDAVGLAIARHFAERGAVPGVDIVEIDNPADLPSLLVDLRRVVIADAVVGFGSPGQVFELREDALPECEAAGASSHGFSVAAAIRLARAVYRERVPADLHLVGVSIDAPRGASFGLSASTAGALRDASRRIERILRLGLESAGGRP